MFNIKSGTVQSIIYNMSWKHVKLCDVAYKNKKLSNNDILDIKEKMFSADCKVEKRKELSKIYNISTHTVYEIETNRRHKNI